MIVSYQKFSDEYKLLEGLREMKFVLSERMVKILLKINHPIAVALLELNNDLDSRVKQTFIDVHETKDDYIMFIQANKASELLNIADEERYSEIDKSLLNKLNLSSPVYRQFRGEIKIGKLVNNIFGVPKFASSLENFVSLYKALSLQDEKFELMELVQGDDIAYWYDCNRYASSDDGSLGSSCMSSVESGYFDIYCENNSVSMLILYKNDSKTKIKGRAIVWDLIEPEGRTYMDRIYTNDSSDEELYVQYAKKQGWLIRSSRGYSPGGGSIIDSRDDSSGDYRLVAQLDTRELDYYPYMDTMTYYNIHSGKVSNREGGMTHYLQSTGGDAEELDAADNGNEVYSRYEGRDIYESEAKWCDFGEDWVLESHAIKIFNSNDRYAVPGHPDIVRCYIPDVVDKHFEKTKCIFSDFLNTWIFKSSVRNVWTDIDRSNSVKDYMNRKGKTFAEVNGEYWSIDLVEQIDGVWKLKNDMRSPVNKPRGWHSRNRFVDDEGSIFSKGKYVGKE